MTCPIEFLKKLAICFFVQNVVSPFLAAPFPPPSRGLKDANMYKNAEDPNEMFLVMLCISAQMWSRSPWLRCFQGSSVASTSQCKEPNALVV